MASLELFTDKDIERLEKVKQLLQDIKELDIGFKLSNVIEADKDTTLLFSCGLIREQDKKRIEVELTDKLQIHCVVLPVNTMLEKGIKRESNKVDFETITFYADGEVIREETTQYK